MTDENARERLEQALSKIESRMRVLEARPDREEIEAIKARRQGDLEDIQELRKEVETLIGKQKDG